LATASFGASAAASQSSPAETAELPAVANLILEDLDFPVITGGQHRRVGAVTAYLVGPNGGSVSAPHREVFTHLAVFSPPVGRARGRDSQETLDFRRCLTERLRPGERLAGPFREILQVLKLSRGRFSDVRL
jgi:hypothetical protein